MEKKATKAQIQYLQMLIDLCDIRFVDDVPSKQPIDAIELVRRTAQEELNEGIKKGRASELIDAFKSGIYGPEQILKSLRLKNQVMHTKAAPSTLGLNGVLFWTIIAIFALLFLITFSGCATTNHAEIPVIYVYQGFAVSDSDSKVKIDKNHTASISFIPDSSGTTIGIAIQNHGKSPIKTNYMIDKIYLVDKEQRRYDIEISASKAQPYFYKSKIVNPMTSVAIASLRSNDPAIKFLSETNNIEMVFYHVLSSKIIFAMSSLNKLESVEFDSNKLRDFSS